MLQSVAAALNQSGYQLPLLTDRLTTTPLITGPVTVLISVKTFCSSASGALAT